MPMLVFESLRTLAQLLLLVVGRQPMTSDGVRRDAELVDAENITTEALAAQRLGRSTPYLRKQTQGSPARATTYSYAVVLGWTPVAILRTY